jgi:monoamine oxidase
MIGGMQEISLRMARDLGDRVVLGAPVRAIDQETDGVVVHSDQGEFRAPLCIIAVPPALAGRIHYRPAMPARRDHLSQRMPMGSVIKYVAAYKQPFWRQAGFSGEIVTDGGPVGLAFDDSSHDGSQAALVAFTDGGPARVWTERTAEERRQAVLEHFAQFFGPQAREPIAFVEKNWTEEPWCRGCYVGLMPPGAMTALGEALRTVCGRIHWAGTETATEWMGYIDGAVQAGYRAADEVIQRLRTEGAAPVRERSFLDAARA